MRVDRLCLIAARGAGGTRTFRTSYAPRRARDQERVMSSNRNKQDQRIQDEGGSTPLHLAIWDDSLEAVTELLRDPTRSKQ